MKILRTSLVCFLIFSLLLSLAGCVAPEQQENNQPESVSYPWVKGDSPIPAERTGILRKFGIAAKNYEFTDTGVYYITPSLFLMYADHGSDTFVMLCNRPDCLHADQPMEDWVNCNASVNGSTLCYYNDQLYIFGEERIERCNLDGTDRVTVLSLAETLGAYSGYSMWSMWNGILTIYMKQIDEDGNDAGAYYYYKLDGSMEKPERCNPPLPHANRQGAFIGQSVDGDTVSYLQWDPDTDVTTYLTDELSSVIGSGYYGPDEAFVTQGSKVRRYVYADESITTLFDTGLKGDLYMSCFPDCITISEKLDDEYTLHFYNWAYEHLGSVKLDYDMGKVGNFQYELICGETHEKIILAAGKTFFPKYYIDKSEFGTGNINIYEYKLPDLPE